MADNSKPLENVFERVLENTSNDVSLSDVLKAFDDRSFGPFFIIFGIAAVVPPLSGIPGFPSVVGIVISLFSIQMLVGRSHIWLPHVLLKRSVKRRKIKTVQDKSADTLQTVDKVVTKRFEWAVSGKARYLAALLVTLLALLMIPLELVPFAVAIPGSAIALIGVALVSRDGAIMLLAYVFTIAALFALVRFAVF